ncbi:hypothetical protein [Epilithonimonas sp.]|uniref:hypothetical protein n=1 Tax=Epilithonimonas sp. TaxID=2894511 RepID=UPI00289AD163|nr:hypothetical protein [Epilithonimonas sp.]
MFGLALSILILVFGIFLRITDNRGFASSKRFSWLFIALGIITLIGKIVILYQKGEL